MATTYPVAQASVLPQRRVLTIEQALYLLIGVLSVLAHLLLLGDRALHHDETLHAEYSWRIYRGQGYVHDPLLHGPFLYYFTALVYFLFGDSDTTARLSAALFGMVAVLLPVLLRREMGRGGALLASAYLLLSPAFLYVGRFIRHDIFAVTFELLAVIGLVRYMHSERPGWHYLFAAALGLMLATMETFYLFVLIVGSYVALVLLWSIGRHLLLWLGAYLLLVGIAFKGLPRIGSIGPVPLLSESQALEVRHQPDNNWGLYFRKLGPVLGPTLSHPATILVIVATLALMAVLIWQIWWRRDTEGRSAWRRAANQAPAGSILRAVDRVPGMQWLKAILIASGIYAVFYTALLSNPGQPNTTGLVTGVLGSFLYWLGQHGVRRGGQPSHYYLFQLSVYEPLLLIFGGTGVTMVLRRFLGTFRRRMRPAAEGSSPTSASASGPYPAASHGTRLNGATGDLFVPGLLAWWSVLALVVYSWAGEKMPWLTIHMLLPLALLSGWTVGRLLEYATQVRIGRWLWLPAAMATVSTVAFLIGFNSLVRSPRPLSLLWIWPLAILMTLAMLVLCAAVFGDRRHAVLAAVGAIVVLLLPLTIRSSLRLSYMNGDVPVEPLIYVQTSPDVVQAVRDAERVSLLYGGRRDLPIRYDNETVWKWYFRNFTHTEGSGGQVVGSIDPSVQAVFLLLENLQTNQPQLEGYIQQRYPLRWWFPECEMYRFPASDPECGPNPGATSLLGRFLRQPYDGAVLAEMWQFMIHRQAPGALGSTDWVLLVRPEVAHEFGLSPAADE